MGIVVDAKLMVHSPIRNVVHKVTGFSGSLLRSTVNKDADFLVDRSKIIKSAWIIAQACEMQGTWGTFRVCLTRKNHADNR